MAASTLSAGTPVRMDLPEFYDGGGYYGTLARLRREEPVFWHEEGDFWVLTRHADVRTAAGDAAAFTTRNGYHLGTHLAISRRLRAETGHVVTEGDPMRAARMRRELLLAGFRGDRPEWVEPEHLHSMDLPGHKGVRNVFRDQFTPRAIQRLDGMVGELARAAFDNAGGSSDEIDFVPTIAWQVPMDAIAILMGLPRADWQDFRRWSEVALAITVPKDAEAKAREKAELSEFYGYLRDHIAHRREHPADDLMTCMAQARIDGEYLPDYRIEMLALQLLTAGNETTRSGIAGAALALDQFPSQRQRLIDDPGLVEGAADEFLRWVTPARAFGRTAKKAVEIRGKRIEEGEFVLLSFVSANRDEDAWENPDVLDVGRVINPMHVTFGYGIHVCLGAHLARLEVRAVIGELLRRHPGYQVTGDPVWGSSIFTNSLNALPVRLG